MVPLQEKGPFTQTTHPCWPEIAHWHLIVQTLRGIQACQLGERWGGAHGISTWQPMVWPLVTVYACADGGDNVHTSFMTSSGHGAAVY